MQNKLRIYYRTVGPKRRNDEVFRPLLQLARAICKLPRLALLLFWVFFGLLLTNVDARSFPENILVLGVRADAPPFSFLKGRTEKNYQGYSVELCKRIAIRAVDQGIYSDFTYQKVSASDRFTLLRDGEIDMLCGASTVTLERMKVVDFSLFTFLSGASVMYQRQGATESKDQTDEFKIGYLRDTTTEEEAQKIVREFQRRQDDSVSPGVRAITAVLFDDHVTGLDQMLDHKFDAYLADREILLALRQRALREHNIDLIVSNEYFSVEPYAIGLRPGKSDLRFIANSVLSEMFDWNRSDGDGVHIFDVLRHSFPGKKFSKSLEDMFRIQRLSVGSKVPSK